jgi:hypothetical protein
VTRRVSTGVERPRLDVFGADAEFGEASRQALRKVYRSGALLACDVVWAEG